MSGQAKPAAVKIDIPAEKLEKFFKGMADAFESEEFQKELTAAGFEAAPKDKPEPPMEAMKRVEAVRVERYKKEWASLGIEWEKGLAVLKAPGAVLHLPEAKSPDSTLRKAIQQYVKAEEKAVRTAVVGEEAYAALKEKEKDMRETMQKADKELAEALEGLTMEQKKEKVQAIQKRFGEIQKTLQGFKGDQKKMAEYVEGLDWEDQRIMLQVQIMQTRARQIAAVKQAGAGGGQPGGKWSAPTASSSKSKKEEEDDDAPPPLE